MKLIKEIDWDIIAVESFIVGLVLSIVTFTITVINMIKSRRKGVK